MGSHLCRPYVVDSACDTSLESLCVRSMIVDGISCVDGISTGALIVGQGRVTGRETRLSPRANERPTRRRHGLPLEHKDVTYWSVREER